MAFAVFGALIVLARQLGQVQAFDYRGQRRGAGSEYAHRIERERREQRRRAGFAN